MAEKQTQPGAAPRHACSAAQSMSARPRPQPA
jgi:hypothetical protein